MSHESKAALILDPVGGEAGAYHFDVTLWRGKMNFVILMS